MTSSRNIKNPANQLKDIIEAANRIVIIQADNPDGDSLGSALAMEEILGEMGKKTNLYCGVDIPDYLKHLTGWDRVSKDIPTEFDASLIVDTSAKVLLEKLEASDYKNWVAARPVIVLDHHSGVVCDIPYATVVINDAAAVATGEVIYKLATEFNWELNLQAKTHLASSILADSLGLSSEATTVFTYRVMANLIESGVDRPALEEARRAFMKMPISIFKYKGRLIERVEVYANDKIAFVDIPDEELRQYSPLYNPGPLVQSDMLQIESVIVAIVMKHYRDGRITGSIRCNKGGSIAADLAKHFGGGGHTYAAGFKITDGRSFTEIKSTCLAKAQELLDLAETKTP